MKKQLELIQHLTNLLHGLHTVVNTPELRDALNTLEKKIATAINAITIETE